MNLFEIILLLFFLLWFVFTIGFQFPYLRKHLLKIDIINILPVWTFFAPNPVKHDYHLLYRDKVDSEISKWEEINIVKENSAISSIWNPERRYKKNLLAVTNSLTREVIAFRKLNNALPTAQNLMNTQAYLNALSVVLNEKYLEKTNFQRQFMIIKTHGYFCEESLEILLVSKYETLM